MSTTGKKIFLIDDSPIVLSRIRSVIEGLPAVGVIRTAHDYASALALLSKEVPDVMILDIHLPDKSGIDLLRYVRRHHPSVTVIMLSNESNERYRLVCRMLGAAHFIDKSIEFDKLPAILASLTV